MSITTSFLRYFRNLGVGNSLVRTESPIKHAVVLSAWDPLDADKYIDTHPNPLQAQAPTGVERCRDC